MSATEVRVLSKVVDVARIELREMEGDDVPPRLRKVVKSSARVLPSPFAQSVLNEIRNNDQFRTAVIERWRDRGEHDSVGLAFLSDPDGAQELVALADRDSGDSQLLKNAEDDALRITALEGQLLEAKRRLRKEREAHTAIIKGLSIRDDERRESLVRSAKAASGAKDIAQAEIVTLEGSVASLRAQLAEAHERLRRGSDREKRKSAVLVEPKGDQRPLLPSDPVALAVWLDTVERIQRPYRVADGDESVAAHVESLEVPVGISPDDRNAISSLIAQRPRTIVIDGYNVAGLLSSGPIASASNRAAVISKADRLASVSGSSVIVVFDAQGSDADDPRPQFRSPGGVDVRFSVMESADDQIVDIILSDPERSVVVTNDRELRERCLADGCVPVWSTAFVDWSIR